MFCKSCGRKLPENIETCLFCEQNQKAEINGNGFWDLCDNAYEAVLDGRYLDVKKMENDQCRVLIEKMLNKDPENRTDMRSVFMDLNSIYLYLTGRKQQVSIDVNEISNSSEDGGKKQFFRAGGDL